LAGVDSGSRRGASGESKAENESQEGGEESHKGDWRGKYRGIQIVLHPDTCPESAPDPDSASFIARRGRGTTRAPANCQEDLDTHTTSAELTTTIPRTVEEQYKTKSTFIHYRIIFFSPTYFLLR
jgi:hypothetical protein